MATAPSPAEHHCHLLGSVGLPLKPLGAVGSLLLLVPLLPVALLVGEEESVHKKACKSRNFFIWVYPSVCMYIV